MSSSLCPPSALKLSFCISTLNRATLIGATLESIIAQATEECEILVLDAASTDHTERVVSEYARDYDRLRYVRQDTNNGIDRDFDRAVELARGEYCWLMPDDDLLIPGAVSAVLEAIRRDYSLVVVNAECRDVEMSTVVVRSCLDIRSDLVFRPAELDGLFEVSRMVMTYLGCVVIKRTIWLERERARYYGSWFIHIGVIFQAPLPGDSLVMAAPLVSIRIGNQSWLQKSFSVVIIKLPSLIRSLPLSDSAKRKHPFAASWRSFLTMLFFRALDTYSFTEFRQHIRPHLRSFREALIPAFVAMIPGVVANTYLVFLYSTLLRRNSGAYLVFLRQSRYYVLGKPVPRGPAGR